MTIGGRGGRSRRVFCITGAGDTLRLLVYKPRVGRSSPVSRGATSEITLILVQSMFAQAHPSRGPVLYHEGPIVSPCTVSRVSLHRPPLDARSAPRESSRLPSAHPLGSPSPASRPRKPRNSPASTCATYLHSAPHRLEVKNPMISRRYVSRSSPESRKDGAQCG